MKGNNKLIETGEVLPKVSVIIPVYNSINYLRNCIDSVVNQSLADIEIICGDGGSSDGSLELLNEYKTYDSRIYVITRNGYGYGQSMNECIKHARGEYIGIVEADDFIESNMFFELYQKAKLFNADIVKSDFFEFIQIRDKVYKWKVKSGISNSYYNNVFCPRYNRKSFRCAMQNWTGIYKKSFLVENDIFYNQTKGASYQDNGFWFKGFTCAKRLVIVPQAFYYYRQDNPSSSIHNKDKVFEICDEYDYIKKWLFDYNLYDDYKNEFWMARFGAYEYTYRRISNKNRAAFLDRMREDFLYANTTAMNRREKDLLRRIQNMQTEDFERYYYRLHNTFIAKFRGAFWCWKEHGFTFLVNRVNGKILRKLISLKLD